MNNNNATIEVLTGSNYKRWKQDIEFALGIADIDMALREDEPPRPTDKSTRAEKELYAKWEKSNRLSLLTMKRTIADYLKGGIPETTNAKEFLTAVGKRFQVSNNAEAAQLMIELTGAKYDSSKGVREYILRIVDIQSKLKSHEIPINDAFVVYHTLNSLPTDFSQIKTAYIAQNQTWSVNDLISKCVVEEEKLKKEIYE